MSVDLQNLLQVTRDRNYQEHLIEYYKFYALGEAHYHEASKALTSAIFAKVLAEKTKKRQHRMYDFLKSEHQVKFNNLRTDFPLNVF